MPGDWTAWAGLAADYVQEARITADPTYYPKADGAVAKSLQIQPHENFLALTVKATIAAARHDFAGALKLSPTSRWRSTPYSAVTYGVRGDALDELGRYAEALASFEKMDHLRPSLSSYSRLSYAYELRGDLPAAPGTDLQLALGDRGVAVGQRLRRVLPRRTRLGQRRPGHRRTLLPARGLARSGLRAAARGRREGRGRTRADRRRRSATTSRWSTGCRSPRTSSSSAITWPRSDAPSRLSRQYGLVLSEEKIFQSQGVNVDLELSLFQADHGDPTGRAQVGVRRVRATPQHPRRGRVRLGLHSQRTTTAEALPHANAALRSAPERPVLLPPRHDRGGARHEGAGGSGPARSAGS